MPAFIKYLRLHSANGTGRWTWTTSLITHEKTSFWVMLSRSQAEDSTLSVALLKRELPLVVLFCWAWSHVGRVASNLLCSRGILWIVDAPASPSWVLDHTHAPSFPALGGLGTDPRIWCMSGTLPPQLHPHPERNFLKSSLSKGKTLVAPTLYVCCK